MTGLADRASKAVFYIRNWIMLSPSPTFIPIGRWLFPRADTVDLASKNSQYWHPLSYACLLMASQPTSGAVRYWLLTARIRYGPAHEDIIQHGRLLWSALAAPSTALLPLLARPMQLATASKNK